MPVFTKQLNKVETKDPEGALRQMASHIRYIQEQLEYTLLNLDSSNIREIETDKTNITSSQGTVTFTGDIIALTGKNGETFRAGKDVSLDRFVFEVKGKNGLQLMYVNDQGDLIITKNSKLSIDCGEW